MAVTKGFGFDAVEAAVAAGAIHLGENYAQELVAKAEALDGRRPAGVALHRRASSATRSGPASPTWTCGRPSTGPRWAPRSPSGRRGPGSSSRSTSRARRPRAGARPRRPPTWSAELVDLGLDVAGPDGRRRRRRRATAARSQFAGLAALRADLGLAELSMGMSADLEAAVAEGATIVRVGQRPLRPPSAAFGLRRAKLATRYAIGVQEGPPLPRARSRRGVRRLRIRRPAGARAPSGHRSARRHAGGAGARTRSIRRCTCCAPTPSPRV